MNLFDIASNNLINFIFAEDTLKSVVSSRFFLIVFVLIISSVKNSSCKNMWTAAMINIPGTFLHELSHYIVGLITNTHPTGFTVFPRKEGDYYVMGSVGQRNLTFYNALPSAMAPLLLLPVGYCFDKYFFSHVQLNIVTYMMYILLESIIIENALPSGQDFKVGFSILSGVLFYGIVILLFLVLFL